MASSEDRPATARNVTSSPYSPARASTAGNSRRQVPHHSAQKTRYTGRSWDASANSDPLASVVVKSGATGPSGTVVAVEAEPPSGAAVELEGANGCASGAAVVAVLVPPQAEASRASDIKKVRLRIGATYCNRVGV